MSRIVDVVREQREAKRLADLHAEGRVDGATTSASGPHPRTQETTSGVRGTVPSTAARRHRLDPPHLAKPPSARTAPLPMRTASRSRRLLLAIVHVDPEPPRPLQECAHRRCMMALSDRAMPSSSRCRYRHSPFAHSGARCESVGSGSHGLAEATRSRTRPRRSPCRPWPRVGPPLPARQGAGSGARAGRTPRRCSQ